MSRWLFLLTLLVASVSSFSPRTAFGVQRRSHVFPPVGAPLFLKEYKRRRLSPCFVQTSLDETTTASPSSTAEPIPEFPFRDFHNTNSIITWEKAVNGAFLLACFGFALFTILNIDHGMTRGWTQSEIAMRIPLDNWSSYESALLEKPVVTKTMINVIIYLLGDWLSQTVFQGNNVLDFDVSRTLKNGLIGLCFGPLVHEYYEFSDHILPVEGGMLNRASKILMDQTLYLTVKCSLYISAVGLLGGDDIPTVKENVKERIGPVVLTAWKFWPLVHCITYGLIPARHRILWVNCVDLVWNAILASKAQGDDDNDAATKQTDEDELELVECTDDTELIERIKTTDDVQVFDARIQSELLDILPTPPEEIAMDSLNMSNTTAVAPTA